MAVSKTNPNRNRNAQKAHFCPTCDETSKPFMRMPGRKMFWRCEGGHEFRKDALILR